jgi:hypothetical protein
MVRVEAVVVVQADAIAELIRTALEEVAAVVVEYARRLPVLAGKAVVRLSASTCMSRAP